MVIDADLIHGLSETNPPDRLVLLAGLLTHEFVALLRYSDEGPPPDLPPHPAWSRDKAHTGWLAVTGYDGDGNPRGIVYSEDDDSITESVVHGHPAHNALFDADNPTYSELGAEAAADRRRRDLIAAKAAESAGADIFITERPYLYATNIEAADGVVIAGPHDALALVSLYLRAQGRFVGWRNLTGKGTTTLRPGSFYTAGAIELVPHAWRALRPLVEHAQIGGTSLPLRLGQAVVGRLQQALAARDSMYWALNRRQDGDTADDALSAFDLAVLALMGAVDASARIAHELLPIARDYAVGWTQKRWRTAARESSADVDSVFTEGDHQHALTILSSLRNTIHGAQLDPLAVANSRRQVITLVELPEDSATLLLSAMNNLGGATVWGVVSHRNGQYADPAQLLDALLPRVAAMLDAVMAIMPVADLAGVNPANQIAPPPSSLSFFGYVPRESILWQLGLA